MHFKTISKLFQATGFAAPEHPLFGLTILEHNPKVKTINCDEVPTISCDFYIISLKKLKAGTMHYGKTRYDHDHGSLFFCKPHQLIGSSGAELDGKGFAIYFHEDFLMGHPLFDEIKKYSFFDFESNQALHISPREDQIIWDLYHKMELEYTGNPDEYSKFILLSYLDSLLQYARRFYRRQFIDRRPLMGATITRFNDLLDLLLESGRVSERVLPTVSYLASQLNLSPKYLSELLKQETGKTAIELIHLKLISEAKNLLTGGNKSISEIAFDLGFNNLSYFSRLFKKETGMKPNEFRDHLLN